MTREVTTRQQGRAAGAGLLFVIFMLGMGLRLYGLDSNSLWLDEVTTATTAQLDVGSILQFHLEEAGNPPLLSLIIHVFFGCWGQNEFVARLPSALFGSLSILLAYKVGETLWTREVGMTGAFLLAVNAYHVQYSQEARHYALMVFLALLSLIFLLKALRGNRKGLWIGFVLCTALSLYNHYFAFLFLPAAVLFGAWVIAQQWLSHRRRGNHVAEARPSVGVSFPARQTLMFCLSLSLIAMSYLPWISALRAQFPKQLESPALGVSMAGLQLSLDFSRDVFPAYSGASGALLLLWLGLFLWGLATCGHKPRLLLVVVWIGASFAFLSMVKPSHPVRTRYVIFLLPIYLLVIARGLESLSRLLNRAFVRMRGDGNRRPAFGHTLVVLLFGAVSVAPLSDYLSWQKEDWRSTTAYLLENMASHDIIIADGEVYRRGADAFRTATGLDYYFSVQGKDAPVFLADSHLVERIEMWAESDASAWGVLWHVSHLANLEELGDGIEIVEFPRVAVVRLLDPQKRALTDAVPVLETLLLIQPRPTARFDLHLALAGIYLREGDLDRAASQLDLAGEVNPGGSDASRSLHKSRAEYNHISLSVRHTYGPLVADLGGVLGVVGTDVRPVSLRPGDTLSVTVWWQALDNVGADYTAFIHLVDSDGGMTAQDDRLLIHRGRHTSEWLLGETARQVYQLRLVPDTPPGEHTLAIGAYYWETGERLPVWDESGERALDDTIVLETIVVTE